MVVLSSVDILETGVLLIISHMSYHLLTTRKAMVLPSQLLKNIKFLLSKCLSSGQDCDQAVYEWRNAPHSDGYSPAQLLLGGVSLRLFLPPLFIINSMMSKKLWMLKTRSLLERFFSPSVLLYVPYMLRTLDASKCVREFS